jgi:hypothetical protein
MNGGHSTLEIFGAAAVNATFGVEEPEIGYVRSLNDGLLSSGTYVGNSDDGGVFTMFHDALFAVSHSENSAA